MFADYVVKNGKFSINKDEKHKTNKIGIMSNKPTKKSAYGNLFNS